MTPQTVWKVLGPSKKNKRCLECMCVCGKVKDVWKDSLRCGGSLSCGCIQKPHNLRHGMNGSPTHNTWLAMRRRCSNYPNSHHYPYYFLRGIRVCDRWNSFENFFADMGEKPEGMTLDRIDNDKGYSPDNCRWADMKTQRANRSDSKK